MRVLNVGGSPLSNFMDLIEEAARRQGFVLINGDELVDPAQFFSASNDNDEDCGCPPGFCANDADLGLGDFSSMAYGHGEPMMTGEQAYEADLEDKKNAVAQLGRILENLTIIAAIQADLVAELMDS